MAYNTAQPWTDDLSVNKPSQPAEDAAGDAAPALNQGTLPASAGGSAGKLVDPSANVGDVVTLVDPATGEVAFAPSTGGALEVVEQDFPGVAQPGSPTIPTVHTIVHNLGKFPKHVQVYVLKTSGEYALIDGIMSPAVGQVNNWSNSEQYTGVPNTVNQQSIALFYINDVGFTNPTTVKVRLEFE